MKFGKKILQRNMKKWDSERAGRKGLKEGRKEGRTGKEGKETDG